MANPAPTTSPRKPRTTTTPGADAPSPRAALALARSQAYQDAADAPSTLRAYAADLANYDAWCGQHGFTAMPATPEVVGAYLAAAGEGYAMPTLRRRVAAIARACGIAGQPLDTKHPAIRETLRGIGRKHGAPARRAAALTTAEVRKLARVCGTTLAGARDRALFLVGFAAALRRSELVGLDVADLACTTDGVVLRIRRSKTDARRVRGRRRRDQPRPPARDLSGDSAAVLADAGWDQRRAGVPQGEPRRRRRARAAERRRRAPGPAQARWPGRRPRQTEVMAELTPPLIEAITPQISTVAA